MNAPVPIRTSEPPTPQSDAGRWLVGALIELAKRFLGMALAAGFTEAERRLECPHCGQRWRG